MKYARMNEFVNGDVWIFSSIQTSSLHSCNKTCFTKTLIKADVWTAIEYFARAKHIQIPHGWATWQNFINQLQFEQKLSIFRFPFQNRICPVYVNVFPTKKHTISLLQN